MLPHGQSPLDIVCDELQIPLAPRSKTQAASLVRGLTKTLIRVADAAPELLAPDDTADTCLSVLASVVVARADQLIAAAQQLIHASFVVPAHRMQSAALTAISTVCCVAADLLDSMIDDAVGAPDDTMSVEGRANDTPEVLLAGVARQLFNVIGAVLHAGLAQYDVSVCCTAADCLRAALACPALARLGPSAAPPIVPTKVDDMSPADVRAAEVAYLAHPLRESVQTESSRHRARLTVALGCAALEGDYCRAAYSLPVVVGRMSTPSEAASLSRSGGGEGTTTEAAPHHHGLLALPPLIADYFGSWHGAWALTALLELVVPQASSEGLAAPSQCAGLSPILARYAMSGSGLGLWLAPTAVEGARMLVRLEVLCVARIARLAPPTSVSFVAQAHTDRLRDAASGSGASSPPLSYGTVRGAPPCWTLPLQDMHAQRLDCPPSSTPPSEASYPSYLAPLKAFKGQQQEHNKAAPPPRMIELVLPLSVPTWGCLPLLARVFHYLVKYAVASPSGGAARWAAIHGVSFTIGGDLATDAALHHRMQTSTWVFDIPYLRSPLSPFDPASVIHHRLVHGPGAVEALCRLLGAHSTTAYLPPALHRIVIHALPAALMAPAAENRVEAIARYIAGAGALFPPSVVLHVFRKLAALEARSVHPPVEGLFRTFAFARHVMHAWTLGSPPEYLLEALADAIPSMCFVIDVVVDPTTTTGSKLFGRRPRTMAFVDDLRCLCELGAKLPPDALVACLRCVRCVMQYIACESALLDGTCDDSGDTIKKEALKALRRISGYFCSAAARSYLRVVVRSIQGRTLPEAASASSHSEHGLPAQIDGVRWVEERFNNGRHIGALRNSTADPGKALARREHLLLEVSLAETSLFPRAHRPVVALELHCPESSSATTDVRMSLRGLPEEPHRLRAYLRDADGPVIVHLVERRQSRRNLHTPLSFAGSGGSVICEFVVGPGTANGSPTLILAALLVGTDVFTEESDVATHSPPHGPVALLDVVASALVPTDGTTGRPLTAIVGSLRVPFACCIRPLASELHKPTLQLWSVLHAKERLLFCATRTSKAAIDAIARYMSAFAVSSNLLPWATLRSSLGDDVWIDATGYEMYFDAGDIASFVACRTEAFCSGAVSHAASSALEEASMTAARDVIVSSFNKGSDDDDDDEGVATDSNDLVWRVAASSMRLLGLVEAYLVSWRRWGGVDSHEGS